MGAPDNIHAIAKQSDIDIALKAGAELEKFRSTSKRPVDLLHGAPYVIIKDATGAEHVEYLEKQFTHPTFRKGTVKLDDGKSFIAYFEKHGTLHSAIYAKENPAKFVAVLDEHPPTTTSSGQTSGSSTPAAEWRQFRAEFTPALSKEWVTWEDADKEPFKSTEEFAYFLENNLPDIIDPPGAELMEVALNFRVNQDVRYSQAQRLSDGHAEIQFQNVVDGTASGRAGTIKIPETFTIEVPVFAGIECRTYKVDARFRYRLTAQGLKLWYELVRPHKVMEQAFKDLWTEIGDGTKRDILLGTPE